MKQLHLRVIAMCVIINILDGFDILAMAFAAPALAQEWRHVDARMLGALFSVALGGMVTGTIALGILADRVGRRPVILLGLILAAAGMVWASRATSIGQLALARALTGFAVGGIGPSINTMVAEHASARNRAFAIALMQAGFAVGSMIGGLSAVWLVATAGWRGVFGVGAVLAMIMLPLAWRSIPESRAFLDARDNGARPATDRATSFMPVPAAGHLQPLLLASGAFFMAIFCFYLINSWTPTLLVRSGLPQQHSMYVGIMLAAGGVPAALVLGLLARGAQLTHVVAGAMLASAIVALVFSTLHSGFALLLGAAFVLGIAMNAAQIGIYAILPGLYPPPVRASYTGLTVGIGRLGSALGPWLAGTLLAAGWMSGRLFALTALPYLAAALLILRLHRFHRY